MIILVFPTINAQTTVEWSPNNSTWYNFDKIDYGNNTACQNYLKEGTVYYVRGKNGTTSYSYIKTRTDGDFHMEIAIMFALFFITFLLAGATIYFNNELQLFFFLGTVISIIFNLHILADLASSIGIDSIIVNLLWTFYRVGLYVMWFLFLYVFIRIFVSLKTSKKQGIEAKNFALNKKM